jgi:hypothetical protein
MMEGLKIGHLRKQLKEVRKEYYKPLSKMSRQELMDEHSRHKGLMAGKTAEPEPVTQTLEKKIAKAHVDVRKHKVIPGLPQAMGTGTAAATQEGGKVLGEPSVKHKKVKKVESESSGMVDAPHTSKSTHAPKAHDSKAHHTETTHASPGKKVSAYNSFVGKHRRAGKSMSEIAAMWRQHKE